MYSRYARSLKDVATATLPAGTTLSKTASARSWSASESRVLPWFCTTMARAFGVLAYIAVSGNCARMAIARCSNEAAPARSPRRKRSQPSCSALSATSGGGDGFAARLLRAHVRQGAHHLAELGKRFFGPGSVARRRTSESHRDRVGRDRGIPRESEVQDLHLLVRGHHDVGRFEVAVNDAFGVRDGKHFGELAGDAHLHGVGRVRADHVPKALAVDQLKDQEFSVWAVDDVVDLADVRMLQLRQQARFPEEARLRFRAELAGAERLQRHAPLKTFVEPDEHGAHAPGAEHVGDAEVADLPTEQMCVVHVSRSCGPHVTGSAHARHVFAAVSYEDVPTIAFALWFIFLGRASGQSILHVDLAVDRGTTSPQMTHAALAEARAIWSPYGVDVREAGCSAAAFERSIQLHVAVLPRHRADTSEGAIGSIEFAVVTPRPNVSLYVQDVDDLVTATLGGEVRAWPAAERDNVEGRALGRALAHEIGHYLLRSRQHAPFGLMRATQPVPVLIDRDRRRLRLSTPEVVRIALLNASALDRSNRLTTGVTNDRISSQSNPRPIMPVAGHTTTYK